ncbi:hypothetical protein HRED_10217 [Candidatus Haloredivivus sp. G17]|nr:hypothetical protein HRED_10217 [Candidatus Haloredivivus sp. G17]
MTINGLMYVEAGISVSTIESMNPMMPERRNPSETPMNPEKVLHYESVEGV